jgi:hypothetical protein
VDRRYDILMNWRAGITTDNADISHKITKMLMGLKNFGANYDRWYIPDGKSVKSTLSEAFFDGIVNDALLGRHIKGDASGFGIYLWNGMNDAHRCNLSLSVPRGGLVERMPAAFVMKLPEFESADVRSIYDKCLTLFKFSITVWNPKTGRVTSEEHLKSGHLSSGNSGWMIYRSDASTIDTNGKGLICTETFHNGWIRAINTQGFDSSRQDMLEASLSLLPA